MMFRVYTVAAKPGPVTAGGGLIVTPNFTIADGTELKVSRSRREQVHTRLEL